MKTGGPLKSGAASGGSARAHKAGRKTRGEEALALVRRAEPALQAWLRRKVSIPEDRRDILQEVQLAATRRPDSLLGATAPEAWLRRVMMRRYADLMKQIARRGVEEPIEDDELARMSRTISSKVGLKRIFERCEAELPNGRARAIFTLWHRDGLQPAEMAAVLNKQGVRNSKGGRFTPTAVQQSLKRVIGPRLKRLLAEPVRI